jgi:acyl-CoA thioester hydrolase
MKNWPNSAKSPSDAPAGLVSTPVVEIEERVRYSETDRMGVAHNKSHFEWFELGRTEFCRRRGIPYRDIEARGFYLVVVEAFCRYRKPLRYDQLFLIRVALREATTKKVIFDYEILSKEERGLLASGYTVHIVTNARGKVSLLPKSILRQIAGG